MIRQFTKFGYSVPTQSFAVGTSYSVVPLTGISGNKKSSAVPDDAFLESIEIQLSAIAASDTITIFLARDSAGLIPITTDQAAEATQAVTLSAAASTTGGVSFTVGKDYHFDPTVTLNTSSGSIFLAIKASAACTAENVRLNWRA
jgi:hypothetical protein|tara:strand:- start:744 stop:1178 length:435 start_codon:yes stop_codon:yes gene_type:complete